MTRLRRISGASGVTIIELMIAAGIMCALGLGIAELMSGMSKSSRYSQFYNTRTVLENSLKTAVISPRLLCKSLNKLVTGPNPSPPPATAVLNPNVEGNELFTKCVSGIDHPSLPGRCESLQNNAPLENQFFQLRDSTGAQWLSGSDGIKDYASGQTRYEALYYDPTGAPCDPTLYQRQNAPDIKCPFKVTTWFWPICPENNRTCEQATSVQVRYKLETFKGFPGGAPLADSENITTTVPVESARIMNACSQPVSTTQMCKAGEYVRGHDSSGALVCGMLPRIDCPAGQVAVGMRVIQNAQTQQDELKPECLCAPGSYLKDGACVVSDRCQSAGANRVSLVKGYKIADDDDRFASTVGNLDFECEVAKQTPIYQVTLTKTGTACNQGRDGIVDAQPVPAGAVTPANELDCGAGCGNETYWYKEGMVLTMSASWIKDNYSYFVGWSGSCSGTGPCNISSGANVTATFNNKPCPEGPTYERLNPCGPCTPVCDPSYLNYVSGYTQTGNKVCSCKTVPSCGGNATFSAWPGDCQCHCRSCDPATELPATFPTCCAPKPPPPPTPTPGGGP